MPKQEAFYNDQPAVYELGLTEGLLPMVSVYRPALAHLQKRLTQTQHFIYREQESKPALWLKGFVPAFSGSWGYQGFLKRRESFKEGWYSWECQLPKGIQRLTPKNTKALLGAALSLALVFENLEFFEGEGDSELPQLMYLKNDVHLGRYGGTINAHLTPTVSAWLLRQPNLSECPLAEEAMRATHRYMSRASKSLSGLRPEHFRVQSQRHKRLDFWVGDRSGGRYLANKYNSMIGELDEPYATTLESGNVDTQFDQLVLFGGLCGLSVTIRQEEQGFLSLPNPF